VQKYFKSFKNLLNLFTRGSGDAGRSLMSKLRDHYQLIVRDDDTLEEVASFKLSPLTIYVGLSSLIVATAIGVTLLIIYTPMKRYIPGYGDLKKDSQLIELRKKVNDLEDLTDSQNKYIDNFSHIVRGDVKYLAQASDTIEVTPQEIAAPLKGEIPENASEKKIEKSSVQSMPGEGQAVFVSEKPLELLYLVAPIRGEVSKPFNPGQGHFGVDLLAGKGTPVQAALDGVVILANFTAETGYTIGLQHSNNVITWYKHNSTNLKKEGQNVRAGEAIAIIGNTGEQTTGPHLHFELWFRGKAVNPRDFINF
jgi:murein DD-endopeptidase MepM/ murein hydrolase activator NlpD